MSRCPPASGTPFITQPRAKKKPRGPTEESRPKQNLLVYPRTPPHRQVDAILPAASSTLERASELIDAKRSYSSKGTSSDWPIRFSCSLYVVVSRINFLFATIQRRPTLTFPMSRQRPRSSCGTPHPVR